MGERGGADCGLSIVEAVVALCLATALTALALPLTGNTVDEGRARQAAAFMAARLRDAKHQATMRGATVGLVFSRQSGRWLFDLCLDGNANGLRRADLDAGLDTCPGEPLDLAMLFPGISVAVDPAIRGPEGDPPTSDPVRFGSSDIASCSPFGGCTAGSLFLQSERGVQFMVRIAGVTGRTRVLRYDAAAELWRER